jgi:ribonuclease-3
VIEALIGATYVTLGQVAATELVLRLVAPLLDDVDRFGASMEPKTELQELCDRRGIGKPVYSIVSEGPDHARRFVATVTIDDVAHGSGEGTSKKAAEGVAALAAWTVLTAD